VRGAPVVSRGRTRAPSGAPPRCASSAPPRRSAPPPGHP
jgi:hypothetical protein